MGVYVTKHPLVSLPLLLDYTNRAGAGKTKASLVEASLSFPVLTTQFHTEPSTTKLKPPIIWKAKEFINCLRDI